MHPVYVGPKSVKDTCLSKYQLCMRVLQYTDNNISIVKPVDPGVTSLRSAGISARCSSICEYIHGSKRCLCWAVYASQIASAER